MRLPQTAVLAVASLAFAAGPTAAASFDAFTSFDGNQGTNNFFYGTIDPTNFANSPQFLASCTIGDFCLTNFDPVSLVPLALKSSTPLTFGTVNIPADRLLLHPGISDDLAVIGIFQVPTTASYRVDILFSLQDIRPTGVGISEFSNPFGPTAATLTAITTLDEATPNFSSSSIRLLNAGDIIGFVIDRQGDFSNDSTGFGLTLTSVPEPASWALMITGFGLVGAALRRRALTARLA